MRQHCWTNRRSAWTCCSKSMRRRTRRPRTTCVAGWPAAWPRGALVPGTHSRASGPLSYMRVFDKSCETLESAGSRRGAQMGMIRCDHPDIEDFVNAKRDGSLANFNMSVAVTDTFMDAVESDGEVELWHVAEPYDKEGASRRADGTWAYRRVRARDLFDQMMHSTYDHAEPGVVFIDRVNRDDNLSYCESIAA